MICNDVQKLIDYAIKKELITNDDIYVVRNQLMEALKLTDLWDDTFSAEDIRKIYKMRWGIETSFRELKYHIGLIAFHSKKKDCMIQEIFASLIMYNFSMLITENIALDDDKYNQYCYKINYALAIYACIMFFRSAHIDPSNLEYLIARNKCPVRPDRIADRKTRCHSAIGFNYRLS